MTACQHHNLDVEQARGEFLRAITRNGIDTIEVDSGWLVLHFECPLCGTPLAMDVPTINGRQNVGLFDFEENTVVYEF